MAEPDCSIGEIDSSCCSDDVRSMLEPQNIRLVDPGDCVHPFGALKPLTFTFLSDSKCNRICYTDVPLDRLAALDPGDRALLDDEPLALLKKAAETLERHRLAGRVLGIDHLAIGVMAGETEDALLEYQRMVPSCSWGVYNITAMNSSTNVTCHPGSRDAKQSPARMFTVNNIPSGSSLSTTCRCRRRTSCVTTAAACITSPMRSEMVRFRAKMLSILSSRAAPPRHPPWLADVVGACTDQPNLRQLFFKASSCSLLITEEDVEQRCLGYEGFFTCDNVAAITADHTPPKARRSATRMATPGLSRLLFRARTTRSPQKFVTIRTEPLLSDMGELIEVGSGAQLGIGLVPAVASLVGLGLYAWFTAEPENNDDDDSSPGGGLMQPVA